MVKRRGVLLVLVLLLLGVLLAFGIGFLGKRAQQYQAARQALQAARAQGLAEAGMEDARVKLERDPGFPPAAAQDQGRFVYSEPVMDLDGTTRIGRYDVVVDRTWEDSPYQVLRVTVVGILLDGSTDGVTPAALYRIRAELDVAPVTRGTANTPNPDYCRWVNREDLGGL